MRTSKTAAKMRTRYLVAKSSARQPVDSKVLPPMSPPGDCSIEDEWLAHIQAGRIEIK